MKKYKQSIFIGFGVIFSFICGMIVSKVFIKPVIIKTQILREGGYEYISPVLLCNINNNNPYNEDTLLSEKILKYSQGYVDNDISVYFLNLTNGKWSGINNEKTFSPASMLKVPATMEALKFSETDSSFLFTRIIYDGSFDNNKAEFFKPNKSIEAGKSYSIAELLSYIIDNSDNNALTLLHTALKPESFEKLYQDLKIDIPTNSLDFMTTRTYSSFLRVLYNSTYLSRENSEKMLRMMATPDFPEGIQAGIPTNVKVSQKFGERQIFTPQGNLTDRELHDCGIIYSPQGPYILCVMTRGKDFNILASNIRDISKIVYDYFTK
ncbi:serine hydrolase [Patescibacteria group bacterium]|nr:serine hydrolase [Patescibacteria group bacterium]